MPYRVDDLSIDTARFEVRRGGTPLAAEPQVLAVLFYLIEHRHRLVSKDELVAAVWNGKAVSDSALSSRIKSVRQLLGDNGEEQRLIRTAHGRGYHFVGEIGGDQDDAPPVKPIGRTARPSIAVLRFASTDPRLALIADGLPHELIVGLSQLGSLTVIARGSSFRFRRLVNMDGIRDLLGADYVVTGNVQRAGNRVLAAVELVETAGGSIVGGQTFEGEMERLHELRAAIAMHVISMLDLRISHYEADRVRGRPLEQLGAWSLYHLGLQHMFRFRPEDNEKALDCLTRAVSIQPDFARAHAASPFVRFQNAFMHYRSDVPSEAIEARRSAETAILLDDQDPSANLMMGRALWLVGQIDSGLPWIERAIELCPNYAQAIYARAWTQMIGGEVSSSQVSARAALGLSPLDPLRYAFFAIDGFSEAMLGRECEGASLADRAAREPRSHVMIALMAAICHQLAGNSPAVSAWTRNIRVRDPSLTAEIFMRSFPFRNPTRERVETALSAIKL